MNRRRFLAATIAAPLVIRAGTVHAGGWASVRLEEPIPAVFAGEPFVIRFTVHGHDMEDAVQPGLAIAIALRNRETKEVVRFSSPERRTSEPLYEMELLVEEPGAYKWAIQPKPYPALPMPTLHVLEPGSDPATSIPAKREGKVTGKVRIAKQAYAPQRVSIAAGEAVTWTNNDEMTHQVAFQALELDDSPLFAPGESMTITFDRAGEFAYYCGPHPWMTGSVVVE